ncbi:MAG TPA: hypothetical protein PKC73_00035 [Dermatophilaceae bacterium]|jgi:hypothetical protein|nr:hypothetical protein [Dermatophilaceae bacterium]
MTTLRLGDVTRGQELIIFQKDKNMTTLRLGDVTSGQELIIFQKDIGYVLAVAAETKGEFEDLTYLCVRVDSANLPGISEMIINTKEWEVHDASSVEILTRIKNQYMRPYSTR